MFLIVHASVGAVVGSAVGNPSAAAATGFFSHFLLDIIPHGDEGIGRLFIRSKRHGWLAFLAVVDAIAALCLLTGLWLYGLLPNPVAAFAGGVGAMIPDILSGFTILSKDKFLKDFDRLHAANHEILGLEVTALVGGAVQIMTLVAIWSVQFALVTR